MHTPGEDTEALDWSRFVGAQQAAFQAREGIVWPRWRNRRQRDQLANAPVACFRREWSPSLGNALSHRHLWPFLSRFHTPRPHGGAPRRNHSARERDSCAHSKQARWEGDWWVLKRQWTGSRETWVRASPVNSLRDLGSSCPPLQASVFPSI